MMAVDAPVARSKLEVSSMGRMVRDRSPRSINGEAAVSIACE